MSENYWHILLYDGEVVPVKPQNVAYVQKKIGAKEHINTPHRTIMIGNVKDFYPTEHPVIEQKLLGVMQDAAAAFGEIEHNPDGSVIVKAVKKNVPHRKWESYYSHNPAYRVLREDEHGVTMGFLLPVHLINHAFVEDCFPDEVKIVEEKR